jgi:DNA-binding GntR family transcriptional regulator
VGARASKLGLPQLKQESLAQRAYQELKNSILSGKFPPGSQMAEVELAEAMAISRTPVREALAMLRSDGLVEGGAGGTSVVKTLASAEVHELFLIREALERLAVDEHIKTADEASIKELEGFLEQQREAVERNNVEGFLLADEEFHLSIARSAGLGQAAALLASLREKMRQAGLRAVLQKGRMELVLEEHAAIIEALRQRNADKAATALLKHLGKTRKAFESEMPQMAEASS